MIQPINSKPFLTPINFLSMTCGESFIKNQNNLKNRFFAASSLSQNFDAHSSLASRQWSLAPHQNYEEPPCQIPDSSGCFGIYSAHLKVGKFANAGSGRFASEPIQVTIEKLEPEWGGCKGALTAKAKLQLSSGRSIYPNN